MAFTTLKLSINSPLSTADVCTNISVNQIEAGDQKMPVFATSVTQWPAKAKAAEAEYRHGYTQHRELSKSQC